MGEIYRGLTAISNIYRGIDEVTQVYRGQDLIWTSEAPPAGLPYFGDRGLIMGGDNHRSDIDYFSIPTPGNAASFGTFPNNVVHNTGMSGNGRGISAGGQQGNPSFGVQIWYMTIATLGNSTTFGDLTIDRSYPSSASNGTRGLIAGGRDSDTGVPRDSIEYITIATLGNGTTFGDLTVDRFGFTGLSNGSRGVFAGGTNDNYNSGLTTMDYVTINTTGNATAFGDLLEGNNRLNGGTGNTSRGVIGGGFTSSGNTTRIQYITIASPGNAIDFGDLTVIRSWAVGTNNATRSTFSGGYAGAGFGSGNNNTIDYVTIDTPGNATDFGDLTASLRAAGGASGD